MPARDPRVIVVIERRHDPLLRPLQVPGTDPSNNGMHFTGVTSNLQARRKGTCSY